MHTHTAHTHKHTPTLHTHTAHTHTHTHTLAVTPLSHHATIFHYCWVTLHTSACLLVGVMYNIIYPFLLPQGSLDRYIITFLSATTCLHNHLTTLHTLTCALVAPVFKLTPRITLYIISFHLWYHLFTLPPDHIAHVILFTFEYHVFLPPGSGDALSPCLTDTTHIPFPRSHYKPDSHSHTAAF